MTTTTTSAAATNPSDEHLALQQRARDFVERVLRPLELTAEAAAGRLPDETVEHIKREAIAARLQGGRVPTELGGQGWSMLEWFLVNEQFGRVTNGLHWHVPGVYNVWVEPAPSRSSATSCPRCAARAVTPTPSPRPR